MKVEARRKKQKLKPSERTVFFVVRRLVDPETGTVHGALVPQSGLDRAVMFDRGYRVGDELMADLFKSRNARFYRLGHGLAKFVRDNTEDFEGLSVHGALKSLQKKANVECDETDFEIDLGPMGKATVQQRVARSLNFFEMDDGKFALVWAALCEFVRQTYFATWTVEQVAAASEFWEDNSE